MGDDGRAGALSNLGQVVERHHLAGVGAHVVAMQITARHTEGLVRLDEDAIGAVVEVEIVDVLRTHEDAESGGDLRERNVHRLGFRAINGDEHLRVVGRERGV